jgi:hypothetical protein
MEGVPVRVLRSSVASLVVFGVVMVGSAAASAAPAEPCSPRTASTYRYDATSFRFVFAIHLCDDRDGISYGADGLHEVAGGIGDGISIDGIAACTHRVCVVRFGFEHGPERARYNGDVFWGDVAFDSLGPIRCISSSTRGACTPSP